jgi:hypothetical protein
VARDTGWDVYKTTEMAAFVMRIEKVMGRIGCRTPRIPHLVIAYRHPKTFSDSL